MWASDRKLFSVYWSLSLVHLYILYECLKALRKICFPDLGHGPQMASLFWKGGNVFNCVAPSSRANLEKHIKQMWMETAKDFAELFIHPFVNRGFWRFSFLSRIARVRYFICYQQKPRVFYLLSVWKASIKCLFTWPMHINAHFCMNSIQSCTDAYRVQCEWDGC